MAQLFHDHSSEDRYEAAIRYEQARARVRELSRAGVTITVTDFAEVEEARAAYERAAARIR